MKYFLYHKDWGIYINVILTGKKLWLRRFNMDYYIYDFHGTFYNVVTFDDYDCASKHIINDDIKVIPFNSSNIRFNLDGFYSSNYDFSLKWNNLLNLKMILM